MRTALFSKVSLLIGVFVFSFFFNILYAEESKCKNVLTKQVTAREYLRENDSYSKVKQSVINQALTEAVKQAIGTEIREFTGMHLAQQGDKESEGFKELSVAKSKGLIKSYDILEEKVVNLDSGKVLELTIKTDVCIPEKGSMKDIALIGDFLLPDGQTYEALRNVLASVFSNKSDKFTLGSGHPNTDYHDILITGRILSVNKEKKIDKKAKESAQGMAIMKGFLGSMNKMAEKDGKKSPFGGVANSMTEPVAEERFIVKVRVSVSATHLSENRKYAESAIAAKEVPKEEVNSTIGDLAFEASKKASRSVFDKLNGKEQSLGSLLSAPIDTSKDIKPSKSVNMPNGDEPH